MQLGRYEEAVSAFDVCLSVADDRDLIERARENKQKAVSLSK